MGFATDYLVPTISGVILMSFLAWIVFMFYLLIKKLGHFERRKFKKLRKIYGRDYEYKDDILEFVTDALDKKWRYKEINLITQGMPERNEILYTYFLVRKLKKKER